MNNPLEAKRGTLDVKAVAGAVIISLIQEDGTVSFNIGMDAQRAMTLGWTIASAAFAATQGNNQFNGGIIIAKGETNG